MIRYDPFSEATIVPSCWSEAEATLALYLHHTQSISLERLRGLFEEVFGLEISEGALVNIFRRARAPSDADRGRAGTDPGQPRDLLGRDLGAGGQPHVVGVGLLGRGHRAARIGGEPRQERAGARHGRSAPGGLGGGSVRLAARAR